MDLKEIKETLDLLLALDYNRAKWLVRECERLSEENSALKMEASDMAQALHAMQQNTAQKCLEIAWNEHLCSDSYEAVGAYRVCEAIRKEFGP